MNLSDLLSMGAGLIQNNSDEATSSLGTGDIQDALGNLLGDNRGGLDLGSLVSGLGGSGLGDIVNSWFGSGENSSISIEQVTALLGSDKIATFASSLGLSTESASSALAEVVPTIVDKSTSEEGSIIDEMLGQVGGASGAMDMLGKMFR